MLNNDFEQMSLSSQELLDQYGITEYNVGDLISDFETALSYTGTLLGNHV